MSHVTVVGAGAWGTALALSLAGAGETVRLWTWQAEHAARMVADRCNREFLDGFELPGTIQPTADLEHALKGSELVVWVVPSHALRLTLERARPLLAPDVPLVSASKGIENDTGMLLGEVMADVLGPETWLRAAFLSGPSFAGEVAAGTPTNVVIAARSGKLAGELQQRFATPRFRVYSSDDPAGVEVGGALKNVIAIAAGACDGLGFGHNTRAALITRGLAELSRLAVAKGGNPLTLSGLAGMGDLVLTCTGDLSRNRTVGFRMGQGQSLDEVLSQLGHVAEGVKTARSAYDLALRLGVELPICGEVYRVLYEGKSPHQAVSDVMERPLRKEIE